MLRVRLVNTANVAFQEPWSAGLRGVEEPTDLPDRVPAPVHTDPWAVLRPDQAVSTVPGPHGQRWPRRQDRHPRVSVAVQTPKMELLHCGRLDSLRPRPADP